MKLLFVCGAFRAYSAWDVEQNVRRAEEVALRLWKMGAAVICPHTNTRFFEGAAPDDVWLSGDLEMLQRCDALVRIPGWEKSVGAQNEVRFAIKHCIPVFEWPQDRENGTLRRWLWEGVSRT